MGRISTKDKRSHAQLASSTGDGARPAACSPGDRVHRRNWLSRRPECGQTCQRGRNACAYDVISPGREIRYEACFQCLDCAGIYHDPNRCAPVLLYDKRGQSLKPHEENYRFSPDRLGKNPEATAARTADNPENAGDTA